MFLPFLDDGKKVRRSYAQHLCLCFVLCSLCIGAKWLFEQLMKQAGSERSS
jgi:hypothetical protein